MYILAWIVFGILTGIAMQSLFGEAKEKGIVGELLSGVSGAIVGGISAMALFTQRNASFMVFSYILAFIGAFVFLFFFNVYSANMRK